MSKRKWDLTSRSSLHAAAEWIRKDAGALFVLVVRANDCAFAVDAEIAPADATAMVECILPEVQTKLTEDRLEARARVKAKTAGVLHGQ